MRTKLSLACALFAATLLVGCEKSESTSSNPASKPPDMTENSAQTSSATATENATSAANKMNTAANSAANTAANTAMTNANAASSGASSATAPSNSAVSAADTTQAQTLLDQAMQYIKDNKLNDADTVLTKLEAMKSKLPADWASKIDSARAAYNSAKTGSDKLKSLVPGGAK